MPDTLIDPWSKVIGQPEAVRVLRASLENPSHAYLFLGPSGSCAYEAALAFAGDLLAAHADDPDRARRLAADAVHPDLAIVRREGPFITVEQARAVAREASQTPVESDRKVAILTEMHLVEDSGPALLKTIEEPPPGRFFIVIAEEISPDLVTIASRCVTVEFRPVPAADVSSALVAEGHSAEDAEFAAMACSGDLDRARVLVADTGLRERYERWRSVPERLDGTGHAAAQVAEELQAMLKQVLAPLEAQQAEELAAFDREAEAFGLKATARKKVTDAHKRVVRRYATGEWKFGYGVLAARYRDELGSASKARPLLLALKTIADTGEALDRNANESLLLHSVLLRIPPLR